MSSLIHLKNNGLLAITGSDAKNFLQSAITADIRTLSNDNAIYSNALSPQGKILFDFLIYHLDGKIVLDCNKNELYEIAKHLHKYVLNNNVEFEDLSTDYAIFANLDASIKSTSFTVADPRSKALGNRIIVKHGEQIEGYSIAENSNEYEAVRITNGIPDCFVDCIKNKTLPAELSMQNLHAVSFNKGCYIGQEVTSRMQNKTTPKKGLFVIEFSGKQPTPQTPILQNGQEAGWVFSSINNKAIAILKLRNLEKDEPLTLNGEKISYKKPSWA